MASGNLLHGAECISFGAAIKGERTLCKPYFQIFIVEPQGMSLNEKRGEDRVLSPDKGEELLPLPQGLLTHLVSFSSFRFRQGSAHILLRHFSYLSFFIAVLLPFTAGSPLRSQPPLGKGMFQLLYPRY